MSASRPVDGNVAATLAAPAAPRSTPPLYTGRAPRCGTAAETTYIPRSLIPTVSRQSGGYDHARWATPAQYVTTNKGMIASETALSVGMLLNPKYGHTARGGRGVESLSEGRADGDCGDDSLIRPIKPARQKTAHTFFSLRTKD